MSIERLEFEIRAKERLAMRSGAVIVYALLILLLAAVAFVVWVAVSP